VAFPNGRMSSSVEGQLLAGNHGGLNGCGGGDDRQSLRSVFFQMVDRFGL
jgi:hypothetical protein